MTNFRQLFFSFLLAGLFLFAMIQFGGQFALDNEANISVLNDPRIANISLSLNSTLSSASDDAQSGRVSFETEEPTPIADGVSLLTIVRVTRSFTSNIIDLFKITFVYTSTVLGIPAIVLSLLSAILIITLIFFAWRTFRVGE